jgi:2-succinyl-6-hydroxy-2,4-cyclohexadiene-1-carboxylate synthase
LVHGFTQTGRAWAPLLWAFAGHFEVLTPDLPGHGRRAERSAGLWEAARLIGEDCGRAAYVGYSMGGRVALHLALARPDLVERLVLVGATAGIADEDERAARRQADDDLARSLEEDGVESFLERWLARPLFAGLSRQAAGVDARLENTGAGLAASLRLMGTGVQEPLWGRLSELRMPVLLVAGERDAAFARAAGEMADCIGAQARVALVPGAGHACHLEQPAAFADVVLPFVSST